MKAAMLDPKIREAYTGAGLEEGLMDPDEFRTFIDKDLLMWKDIVVRAKLPTDSAR